MFKFVMTKNSNEIFHRAILHNDLKRVKLILEEAMKDPRFNIDDVNDEGLTALQFSCFAGNLEMVKVLVSYGANWKIRDREGYTVLHAASLTGCADVVTYLLRLGLKPTLKTDDSTMPIDVTDEISIIVLLLRAMLDQGYLREMQDYMMDHPKLKRNIFQELEKVKCIEKEKNEILKDLPYTSHMTRKQPSCVEKLKTSDDIKGRSRCTFSEFSDSMQQLNLLGKDYDTNNNNYNNQSEFTESSTSYDYGDYRPRLRRQSSTSSTSSHGSKASRNSTGSGILRNESYDYDTHGNLQRFLENRYPIHQKSVTFDLNRSDSHRAYSDGYISDCKSVSSDYDIDPPSRRAYSDGYISDNCDDNIRSNVSYNYSHTHEQHGRQQKLIEEPLYENTQSLKLKANALATINECHHEHAPPRQQGPPPLPPRQMHHDSNDHSGSERQFGSETDSGIDINETSGRLYALSIDEQNDINQRSLSFSQPMGLFSSDQSQTTQRHSSADDNLPCGFFVRATANNANSKYKSWNGRSLQNEGQFAPYASHRRRTSRNDAYEQQYQEQSPQGNTIYNTRNDYKNFYHENNEKVYNFDHQPEIML